MRLLPYIPEKDHKLPLIGVDKLHGPTNLNTVNVEPAQTNSISGESQLSQAGQLQVKEGTLYKPRADQVKAVDNVSKGFETHDRGKLILPCGVGKTLTSLWIKEKMKPKITLALFPSISLLGQTRDVWMEQRRNKFESICVCSDQTVVGQKKKESEEETESLDHQEIEALKEKKALVTTDSNEIARQIQTARDSNGDLVIFSTYQSLERIQEALAATREEIDLTICDEAHNTAGKKDGMFTLVHDQEKIPSKKRLYMTATEKVVKDFTGKNKEDLDLLCDMDDPEIFGPTFHKMSFREAMDAGIITDYKILAVGISQEELESLGISGDNKALHNYILQKAMKDTGANHALTFHSRATEGQSSALAFAERHQVLTKGQGVDVFHVNGKMPASERKKILKEKFSQSPCAVLTNAKCLREGVDAKGIDMVFFSDPKDSVIEIVQGSSRAFRKNENNPNKIGYIVVPMIYSQKAGMQKSIDESSYKILVNTIAALAEHDERLVDELRIRKPSDGGDGGGDDDEYIDKHFEIKGLEDILTKIIKANVVRDSRKVIEDLIYTSFTEALKDIQLKISIRPSESNFDSELQIHTGLNFKKLQKLYRKEFPDKPSGVKDILDEIYGIQVIVKPETPEIKVNVREPYRNFIELVRAVRKAVPVYPKNWYERADSFVRRNNLDDYISEVLNGVTTAEEISTLFRDEITNRESDFLNIFNAIWSIDITEYPCPYKTDLEAIEAIHELNYPKSVTAKDLFGLYSELRTKLHLTAYKLRELFNMPNASLVELKNKIFSVAKKQEVEVAVEEKVKPRMSLDDAIRLLRRDFETLPGKTELESKSVELGYTLGQLAKDTGISHVKFYAFHPHYFSNFKQAAEAIWEVTNGQVPENLEELFNSKFLVDNVEINLYDLRKLYGNETASFEELRKAIFEDQTLRHFHYNSSLDVLNKLDTLSNDVDLNSFTNAESSVQNTFFINQLGITKERLKVIFKDLDFDVVFRRRVCMSNIENLLADKLIGSQAPKDVEELSKLIDVWLPSAKLDKSKSSYDYTFWNQRRPLLARLVLSANLVKKVWGEDFLKELLINNLPSLSSRVGFRNNLTLVAAISSEEFCILFGFNNLQEIFSAKLQHDVPFTEIKDKSSGVLIKDQILLKSITPPEKLVEFFKPYDSLRSQISTELSEGQPKDLTVVDMATKLWGAAIPEDYWFKQLKLLYPTRPANLETVFGKGAPVNSTRNQQEKDINAIFLAAYRKLFPKQLAPDYKTPVAFWQRMLANKVWTA